MGQIILGFIGAYLLYNFIFRFLIPLIKVTRQVRRQVRDFQQHANTRQGEYQPGAGANGGFQPGGSASGRYQSGGFRVEDFGTQSSGPTYGGASAGSSSGAARQETKPKKDDYIDFEEIK